jgi:RES domain-containing protein
VVYASDTLSLAALEQFIHLGREGLHISFVFFHIQIPDTVAISSIETETLPKDWRREPPPHSTKDIGTKWADSNQTAVLCVPSVMVPIGKNNLLNTHHPDFSKLLISAPKPFNFDPRMLK